MDHLRAAMPDINWSAWANIEPTFRGVAEWAMSAEHANAQVSKALKNWWEVNNESVQACLGATESRDTRNSSTAIALVSIPRSPTSPLNPRYAQIDRRANAERKVVDHMIAPEPVKQEAREQISDAAAIEKYIADVDRRKPQT